MQPTDDQINEFIRITKKVYGKTLSIEEAREIATRFMVCLELLAQWRARKGSNRPRLSPPNVQDIRKPKEPDK